MMISPGETGVSLHIYIYIHRLYVIPVDKSLYIPVDHGLYIPDVCFRKVEIFGITPAIGGVLI